MAAKSTAPATDKKADDQGIEKKADAPAAEKKADDQGTQATEGLSELALLKQQMEAMRQQFEGTIAMMKSQMVVGVSLAQPPAINFQRDTGDPRRMVTIKLQLSKENREPLFVNFGDYKEKIPRGVEFPVPYYVYKHLKECEAQDENTIRMIEGLKEDFERKKAQFGIE